MNARLHDLIGGGCTMGDDERAELMYQDRVEKMYRMKKARHPDCGDPDHPGCPACEEEEDYL